MLFEIFPQIWLREFPNAKPERTEVKYIKVLTTILTRTFLVKRRNLRSNLQVNISNFL